MSLNGILRAGPKFARGAHVARFSRPPPQSFSQASQTQPDSIEAQLLSKEFEFSSAASATSFGVQNGIEEFQNPAKRRRTTYGIDPPSPFSITGPIRQFTRYFNPSKNEPPPPTAPEFVAKTTPKLLSRKRDPPPFCFPEGGAHHDLPPLAHVEPSPPKYTPEIPVPSSSNADELLPFDDFSDHFSAMTISDDEGDAVSEHFLSSSPGFFPAPVLTGYRDEFCNDLLVAPSPSTSIPIQMPNVSPSPMPPLISPCFKFDFLKKQVNQPEKERDWAKEYILALKIRDKKERRKAVDKVTTDFREEAKRVGKIIIEERNEPPERKSIRTMSSGAGGGEKYIHNNIFFKFAVDNYDLYDGDENAMKVAGHEMKGIVAYSAASQQAGGKIQFGMTSLIDYRGFRVIASAILPISQDTLIYGSCDGGQTVKADDSPLGNQMSDCAARLNLKGHLAGMGKEPKFIYGPCDQEGHLGTDGNLYVLDLARLFPPETPNKDAGSFIYRLLRPEFVGKYPHPLSSDSFSLFGRHPGHEEHDEEVKQATRYLQEELTFALATELSRKAESELTDPLTPRHLKRLTLQLHRAGVNLRYLGRVYLEASHPLLKQLALSEMVARVMKHLLRTKLRNPPPFSGDSEYQEIAIDFFNSVFGSGFDSEIMWSVDIPRALEKSFSFAVTFSIREHLNMDLLCSRLQSLTGVRFHSRQVPSNPQRRSRPFTPNDFRGFTVLEKFTHHAFDEELMDSVVRAQEERGPQRRRELLSAEKALKEALKLRPGDPDYLLQIGKVQLELANEDSSSHNESQSFFFKGFENLETSLALRPESPLAIISWTQGMIRYIQKEADWILHDGEGTVAPLCILPFRVQARFRRVRQFIKHSSAQVTSSSCLFELAEAYLQQATTMESFLDGVHESLDLYQKQQKKLFLKSSIRLWERCMREAEEGGELLDRSLKVRGWVGCGEACLQLARECGPLGGFEWLSRAEEFFDRSEMCVRGSAGGRLTEVERVRGSIQAEVNGFEDGYCSMSY